MREPPTLYQRIRVVEECRDVVTLWVALAIPFGAITAGFLFAGKAVAAAFAGLAVLCCACVAVGAALVMRRFSR